MGVRVFVREGGGRGREDDEDAYPSTGGGSGSVFGGRFRAFCGVCGSGFVVSRGEDDGGRCVRRKEGGGKRGPCGVHAAGRLGRIRVRGEGDNGRNGFMRGGPRRCGFQEGETEDALCAGARGGCVVDDRVGTCVGFSVRLRFAVFFEADIGPERRIDGDVGAWNALVIARFDVIACSHHRPLARSRSVSLFVSALRRRERKQIQAGS